MYSKIWTGRSTGTCWDLSRALKGTDAVVVGAGSGLSASAGLTYSGERFKRYFGDFQKKYSIPDMYSGGFFPFASPEEQWAWWSRQIFINRYQKAPRQVYDQLLALVGDRDYFVLTTNVDHQFQLAGFDKKRLFYTQGDYGLWQCSKSCRQQTYDNGDVVRQMVEAQGFCVTEHGLELPEGVIPKMAVPTELVPRCPRCGAPMAMNLRCDDTFVQDGGWYAAASRYEDFLRRHQGLRVLYLELGVGANTPAIIKYPFWALTADNPNAVYACVNQGEAFAPDQIQSQSICLDGDIGGVIDHLLHLTRPAGEMAAASTTA